MENLDNLRLVVVDRASTIDVAVECRSLVGHITEFRAVMCGGSSPATLATVRITEMGGKFNPTFVITARALHQPDVIVLETLISVAVAMLAMHEGPEIVRHLYVAALHRDRAMIEACRRMGLNVGVVPPEFVRKGTGSQFLLYRDGARWFTVEKADVTSRAKFLLSLLLRPERALDSSLIGRKAIFHLRPKLLKMDNMSALRTLAFPSSAVNSASSR
ncbi:MAG: hypothetical protein AB7I36_08625 [Rhodospirillaceae bacterium]